MKLQSQTTPKVGWRGSQLLYEETIFENEKKKEKRI